MFFGYASQGKDHILWVSTSIKEPAAVWNASIPTSCRLFYRGADPLEHERREIRLFVAPALIFQPTLLASDR